MARKSNYFIKTNKQTNQLRRNVQIKQANKHKQTNVSQGPNEAIIS